MKDVLNAAIVVAVAVVLMRGAGPQPSGTDGYAVREAYLSDYREELKPAARDFALRLRSKEFKDSMSAVKAWAAMATDARVKASKPVDKQVAELCKSDDLEPLAAWFEEFAR